MSIQGTQEFTSITFMAIAIGMDVFSASLGMGMLKIRLRRVISIGLLFGLFHMIFPLIGMLLGQFLSHQVGAFAAVAGGILLIGVGVQMIINAFREDDHQGIQPVGFGLFIIALTVSIDSFSVGLSLGMSDMEIVITLLLFGIFTVFFTWLGMLIGRGVHHYLGTYSEILGGSILFSFGIYLILY